VSTQAISFIAAEKSAPLHIKGIEKNNNKKKISEDNFLRLIVLNGVRPGLDPIKCFVHIAKTGFAIASN
jgi:hypothetical protein